MSPPPHTAASTSKAISNALDLTDALALWELEQVALGKTPYWQGVEAGNFLLFHRLPGLKIGCEVPPPHGLCGDGGGITA